ncbi:MAG: hypothetical protein ACYC3X_14755 [Pirellulaceae bacterium]
MQDNETQDNETQDNETMYPQVGIVTFLVNVGDESVRVQTGMNLRIVGSRERLP